jgi:2,4-dienoyl-CoA reductase-like NADH-dependent reductase (Old Yellow Enzyme family)
LKDRRPSARCTGSVDFGTACSRRCKSASSRKPSGSGAPAGGTGDGGKAAGSRRRLGHDARVRYIAPGHARTPAAFRTMLRSAGVDFDLDDQVEARGPLAQPIEVHGRRLANRFCAHPMEGWDGTEAGGPTEPTLRRWRNFGRSGAALVWGGEAFAVSADGRANPHQLHFGPDSERHLGELLAALRAGRREAGGEQGMLAGLQLTHSGRFARPHGPLAPKIAHYHPLLARKHGLDPALPLLSDGELEAIGERFVAAAVVAQRAGFDFVDVKCCHGYLLHEVLAAHTRPGTYGGSFDNRTRLFLRIVAGIRAACPGLHVGVRLSAGDTAPFQRNAATGIGEPMVADGLALADYHFGLTRGDPLRPDPTEPIAFLRLLPALGIQLVNVTLGSPYWNPHLQRPAAYPPSDGYLPPQDPLQMVATHLATVRTLKAACQGLVLVGTGYTYLQEYLAHVGQREVGMGHVDFVGLGRLLLSYPELPADLLQGRELQRRRLCRTFSDCTTAPRNGMRSGCYPLDPFYAAMPEAERVRALKQQLPK